MIQTLAATTNRKSLKEKALFAMFFAIAIPTSTWVVQPFGIRYDWPDFTFHSLIISYGAIGAMVLLTSEIFLRNYFIKTSQSRSLTRYFYWVSVQSILIVATAVAFFRLAYSHTYSLLDAWLIAKVAIAAGLTLVAVLFTRGWVSSMMTSSQQLPGGLELMTLKGNSESDHLRLTTAQFLFAKCADNYMQVYYYDDSNCIRKKLIRITLQKLQSQMAAKGIVRCHRSYLVNVGAIDSCSGNIRSLRIKINNQLIPVSRTSAKMIKRLLLTR